MEAHEKAKLSFLFRLTGWRKLLVVVLAAVAVAFVAPPSAYSQSCTSPNEMARQMVNNFLLKPNLRYARVETGVESYAFYEPTVVSDSTVCAELAKDFSPEAMDGWSVSYFKLGPKYIVNAVVKQPDTPGVVSMGISAVYVYDQKFNLIKGYGG